VEWTCLSVICPFPAAEAVVAAMLDLFPGGPSTEETPEGTRVCAYLPAGHDVPGAIVALEARLAAIPEDLAGAGPLPVGQAIVREEDWAHAWKEFYHAFRLGARLVIKPTWRAWPPADDLAAARPDDLILELDPEMAFGTGTHATTQLCLRALEQHVRPGDRVLDVGCGSGILAIAAARLGAAAVVAVDLDPIAVSTTLANAGRNGVAETLQVERGGVAAAAPGPYDIVVANVSPPVVAGIARDVAARLRPGGLYVVSGTSDEHADSVTAAIVDAGLELMRVDHQEGWACLISRLPGDAGA
jgi:ribosomal protein L11 methyltransferase